MEEASWFLAQAIDHILPSQGNMFWAASLIQFTTSWIDKGGSVNQAAE